MKAFSALEIWKSVPEELTIAKFWAFTKSDFLGLVNFGFLDLADFISVNRFLILLPIFPAPLVLLALVVVS